MSILIKNMEMPKNCDSCRIMVFEDTNCVPELFCGCPIVFKAHPQHEEHRPDYCPLIELPPHGDLIDRSKLAWTPIDITDLPFGECLLVYLKEDVDSAPIVLESEET